MGPNDPVTQSLCGQLKSDREAEPSAFEQFTLQARRFKVKPKTNPPPPL
jgi:hypothetical protein